jgi:hypothetical protein
MDAESAGKRSKKWKVPVSPRTVAVLRAQWRDLNAALEMQTNDLALRFPVVAWHRARFVQTAGSANALQRSILG